MPDSRSEPKVASDGLRARSNRAYAKRKLNWLENYLVQGLAVAQSKVDRVYVDLFAGPGINVDPRSGEEFLSGALRAVQMIGSSKAGAPFTRAYLVNLNRDDHAALEARIDRLSAEGRLRIPRAHIHCIHGDANVVVHEILRAIHPRAWVFVFADLEESRQLPFSTVQALRAQGHQSVDLYLLLPLEMDLQRVLPYDQPPSPAIEEKLDAFFGGQFWREVYTRRFTSSQGAEFRAALEACYLSRLTTVWPEAHTVAWIRLTGRRTLYRMLFAGSNQAALRVALGVAKQEEDKINPEQPDLFR